ncbi:MAG: hypothetical protein JWN73_409 [Betaproteobacteria bacterium]|nr:hypothetical protein [Betaproteobacteria bacterium]
MNSESISHGIQLALAPVFLLTAIAAMIGVITQRLARIIDRGRIVETTIEDGASKRLDTLREELVILRQRAKLVNISLGLFTGSAICVGITTAALFLGEVSRVNALPLVAATFIGSLALFILGLLLYLAEVRLSRHTFSFGRYLPPPPQ